MWRWESSLPESGTPLIGMVNGIDEVRDGEEDMFFPTNDVADVGPPFEWDEEDLLFMARRLHHHS